MNASLTSLFELLKTVRSWRESLLPTDLYKWTMLVGGRPTEMESFHLSFRQGGRQFMPVNFENELDDILPNITHAQAREDLDYLYETCKISLADADVTSLLLGTLEVVYAVPKGEWVDPREPVATLKGPQEVLSWLEPMLIGRMSYMMQVATEAIKAFEAGTVEAWDTYMASISRVTCDEQKELTLKALRGTGIFSERRIKEIGAGIVADPQGYYEAVQDQCRKMIAAGVDPSRFIEVGLRAATCMTQHLIALAAMKDMGFMRTSNVYGAKILGMIPVGTMGHEGIMRWGGNDELAFSKHQDALPMVFFLLDTNDTLRIGLPAALSLILKHPNRNDGGRPDSGDIGAQFKVWAETNKAHGMARPWIFEDGLNDEDVRKFEAQRKELDYPASSVWYGAGGFFIDRPEFTGYRRGRINMIYKLGWTKTYGAQMKFGNEAEVGFSGKTSIPGIPVTYVKRDPNVDGPMIVVGQENDVLPGYTPFTVGDSIHRPAEVAVRPAVSPITDTMIRRLQQVRRDKIAQARAA